MNPSVALLFIVLGALATLGLFFGLERWARKPGLAFLFVGCTTVLAAGLGIATEKRLLPILFLLQAVGFFYLARWRWTGRRSASQGAPES